MTRTVVARNNAERNAKTVTDGNSGTIGDVFGVGLGVIDGEGDVGVAEGV